jgi:hypothetical protein
LYALLGDLDASVVADPAADTDLDQVGRWDICQLRRVREMGGVHSLVPRGDGAATSLHHELAAWTDIETVARVQRCAVVTARSFRQAERHPETPGDSDCAVNDVPYGDPLLIWIRPARSDDRCTGGEPSQPVGVTGDTFDRVPQRGGSLVSQSGQNPTSDQGTDRHPIFSGDPLNLGELGFG